MGLKEDKSGDSEKVSIWKKRETDLTFPNGMIECKHSWMWYSKRLFIGCILIIALTFHRLPRTVVYTQNVLLTAYMSTASLFSQRRCKLRGLGSAEKCICSIQKQHCLGILWWSKVWFSWCLVGVCCNHLREDWLEGVEVRSPRIKKYVEIKKWLSSNLFLSWYNAVVLTQCLQVWVCGPQINTHSSPPCWGVEQKCQTI